MNTTVSLNGTWELLEQPLETGPNAVSRIVRRKRGWVETPVPGDIRHALRPETGEAVDRSDGVRLAAQREFEAGVEERVEGTEVVCHAFGWAISASPEP